MSGQHPGAIALRSALEAWLSGLDLEVAEAVFWTPEEFFGDEVDGYLDRPFLVMTFDSDVHDILWSDTRQRREFEAIVEAHGCSIRKKNYTTFYFTRKTAEAGERVDGKAQREG